MTDAKRVRDLSQRNTLLVLRGALRAEAHILEQWPHLLGQQLHHHCFRRGTSAAVATGILEASLQGRRWIRTATHYGHPASACRWALGRGRDILAARLTRDSRYVVALARDSCVLWNTASGELIWEVAFDTLGAASSLAVAPRREAIAVGHQNGRCSIWDLASGSLLHHWQAADSAIEALALSEAPRRVATFGGTEFEKRLRIWGPPSNQLVRERTVGAGQIVEALVPRLRQGTVGNVRGSSVAAATRCVGLDFLRNREAVLWAQPGAAQVWDWSRDEIVWRTERAPQRWAGGLVSHEDGIVAAQALDGTEEFIVVDESGNVQRSSLAIGEPAPHLGNVSKVVFSADAGRYLATNSRQECRIGWRVADRWQERPADLGGGTAFDVAANGSLVIGVAEDRCNLFEVSDLQSLGSPELEVDGEVRSGAFTGDGTACTLGGYSEIVHVDISFTGRSWRSRLEVGGLTGLDWADGAPVLAACGRDGTLVVVIDRTPRDTKSVRVDGEEFTCVAISADGERIAAGCASGGVWIWDWRTNDGGRKTALWDGAVTAVCWLDGTSLAAAGESQEVRVVNERRPRRQVPLRAHEAWITCLVAVPDRGILLSGGLDGRLCVWERDKPARPKVVFRDRIEPRAMAWLPQLQLVASVDARGLLRLRSESGEEVGLCPLDGTPVALQHLGRNRFGYINGHGEVTLLDVEGISPVSQTKAPLSASARFGLGALWRRWRESGSL
jgi:WD40 repeat protein